MTWPFKKKPNPPPVDNVAWKDVVEQLTAMGFLRAVPPEKHEEIKAEILKRAYLFDECTCRTLSCDAEDIAEGGAVEWLNETRPLLERLGIGHVEASDVQVEPDYIISVNDVRHTIVTESEIQSLYLWAFAQARLMSILDRAFSAAGSEERAYALYVGNNDSYLVILTREMYDVIETFSRRMKHELPTSTADLLSQIEARR